MKNIQQQPRQQARPANNATNVARHSRTAAATTTTPETVTPRPGPTPAEINARQQRDAEALQQANAVVAAVQPSAVAVFDPETYERNLRHDTAGIGPIVTFNGKDGGFFLEQQEFNIDRLFLARPDLIAFGWISFDPEGGPPKTLMCSIGEGLPPPRKDLPDPPLEGDLPNPNWGRNQFGDVQDPWQYQEVLPIAALDATGEVYRMVGRNWCTRKELKAFRRRVADNMFHRRGLMPVVQLIDSDEFNRSRQVSVPRPIISIVGWRNPDGSEAPEAPVPPTTQHDPKRITSGRSLLADEMDDEIPDHL